MELIVAVAPPPIIKEKNNRNGPRDPYFASRLNISMATTLVIDSWEINSTAPQPLLPHPWQFTGISFQFKIRSL